MATARSIAAAAAAAINSALKVKSPSRVTTETGEQTDAGLIQGMKNRASAVASMARAMAQMAVISPIEDEASSGSIAEAARPSRSAVISEIASGGSGGAPAGGTTNVDQGGPTIVYSPTYRFEGGAPTREDLDGANRMSQAEFEKYMKRYLREKGRVSFA